MGIEEEGEGGELGMCERREREGERMGGEGLQRRGWAAEEDGEEGPGRDGLQLWAAGSVRRVGSEGVGDPVEGGVERGSVDDGGPSLVLVVGHRRRAKQRPVVARRRRAEGVDEGEHWTGRVFRVQRENRGWRRADDVLAAGLS